MTTYLFAIALSCTSCDKKSTIPAIDEYIFLSIPEISSKEIQYFGEKITTSGYVLGSELLGNSRNGEIWVLVLGEKPLTSEGKIGSSVFPEYDHKIRIGEDGFNRKIINRCNEICELARNQADLIKVYGTFLPSQAFHHYANGVDLMLDAIEINGVLIDTDFNDHGKIKEKTPTVMRKIYKGGKEVAKLIKKGLL